MPEGEGFVGCIKNLTFSASGKNHLYDLGSPADGENFTPGKNQISVAIAYQRPIKGDYPKKSIPIPLLTYVLFDICRFCEEYRNFGGNLVATQPSWVIDIK